MAVAIQSYNLDVVPGGAPVVVHIHQSDMTARQFQLKLYSRNGNLTIPSGATAYIEGLKPDNKAFSHTAVLDGETVTVTTTAQMTVLPGDVRAQIKIVSGTEVIIAANFILRVEIDNVAGADTSATDIPGLVEQAQAAAEAAEQAAENIDASWFVDGAKTTPIDTYNTTSKLTAGAINELKAQADSADSDIEGLDSRLTTAEGEIQTNATNIATNTSSIATIQDTFWSRVPALAPTDMDNLTINTLGKSNALSGSSVANLPDTAHSYHVLAFGNVQLARQTTVPFTTYARHYSNNTWQAWYPVAGIGASGTLTFTNCTGAYASLRRVGTLVTFNVLVTATAGIPAGSSSNGFITFPEGFRPNVMTCITGSLSASPYVSPMYINTNGTCETRNVAIASGQSARYSGTFYSAI